MSLTDFSLPTQVLLLFLYYSVRAFVLVSIFFLLFRSFWGKSRKINKVPYTKQQIHFEIFQTLQIFVLDAILLVIFVSIGLFKAVNLGLAADILSFLILFIWMEIWFYSTHRLLHLKRFWHFHKTHHRSRVPSPISGFTFSLVERLILFFSAMSLVGGASAIGWPLSIVGVQTYFGVNVFMTVLGHSDLKIYPESWQKTTWLKYLSDPSEHSLHHSKPSCNFGLFTNILDRKLKTFQRRSR